MRRASLARLGGAYLFGACLFGACLFGAWLSGAGPAAATCGPAPDPCAIPEGSYHARLPERPEGAPAVVFLHGYGGNGGASVGRARVADPLLARGYAVVAPNGIPQRAGAPPGWGFFPGRQARDEAAFLAAVAEDAARRFGLDRDRMILAGFSSGGFMVTYLACAAPDAFAAFAPVAGGFWRPHPQDCAGPVRLMHTHGWADSVVPLEGRALGGGQYFQGDIFAGMEIFRAASGCARQMPDRTEVAGAAWRRVWTGCAPGAALDLALFPGGHVVPDWWAGAVVDWAEALWAAETRDD